MDWKWYYVLLNAFKHDLSQYGSLKVIELCNEKSIAVLPIHDSFVVKKQHRDALEAMMTKAYELLNFQSVPIVIDE